MELQDILKDEKIQKGLKQSLFTIDEDTKYINYNIKNKQKYIVTKPEEFVRAKTLVEIVTEYKYDLKYIDFEVRTSIGAKPDIPADIIIFSDKEHKAPYIVYELKKEDISPKEFEQAVNQGFSYAITQNAKYVVVSNGTKQAYYEVLADKPRERESNVLSHIPINFDESSKNKPKFIKGEFDPQPKTEAELIQKFKTCHDTLWAGGKRAPTEAFDELDKLIFCKFFDEKAPRKKGEAYDFQIYGTTEQIEKRIRALYEEGRQKDPQVFREGIKLNNYEIIEIVKILQDINLNKTDLDAKGKAFETFMDGFFRGAFGQFFTPREVVKMIVNVLPINNYSKVLDTSCGSGGFLLYALDKVRKQADEYYEDGTAEHYRFWHDFAEKQLFGIEINEQISRTAKMNMIIHDDGHTNVITYDGLKPQKHIIEDTGNPHFKENSFDFILTNPPFGSTIRSTELEEFDKFELTKKKPDFFDERFKNTKISIKANEKSEILFIERAYQYLKVNEQDFSKNGILAIVLPDGILTNSNLSYIREFIEEHFKYLAIISLPQHTFSVSDAGVKSSILFLQKYDKKQTEKIKVLKEKIKDESYNLYKEKIQEIKKDKKELQIYKNLVLENYKKQISKAIKQNFNYSLLMANAQFVGYDTIGTVIKNNDLIEIASELKSFFMNSEINSTDKNKIFTIPFHQIIAKRIDPNYYSFKFEELEHKLNSSKWELKQLGEICEISRGGSPRPIKEYITEDSDGINWIKIGDTKDINKYIYTTKEKIKPEGVKYSREVKEGDFILSNSMSFGKPYIMKTSGCIHDGWLLLRRKDNSISEDYLYTVLSSDFIYKFFQKETIGGVVENLNIELVKKVRIPIPPLNIQMDVSEKLDTAIFEKEELEKKAELVLRNAKKDIELILLGVDDEI